MNERSIRYAFDKIEALEKGGGLKMEETVMVKLMIMMRSGRVIKLSVSDVELDWLYDRMFGRKVGKFQNLGQMVICVDDIEYLEWAEVEGGVE